ncbi:MAG TPA: hypothetical protein VIJ72_01610 [Rhizomicrobium sp.]
MATHRNHYLLELAKVLRRFSSETQQDAYIEKFLQAADDLERSAMDSQEMDFPRHRIDLRA